ncbi:MAG: hypothetical protein HY000_03665 [Planctomycetes bacterium]|nr:hypothetical protein [Planctomycetota bacterium]
MTGSAAGVGSLDALKEFRAALCRFIKDAGDALLAVDLELRRAQEWLQLDRPRYWQAEIRRREEAVLHAKADLSRAKTTAMFGNTAGCTDQKVALRRAQARLEEAKEKLLTVRRWAMVLEREVEDFKGPSQQLSNLLEADLVAAVAQLDQSITALEAYLSLETPMSPQSLPAGESMGRGGTHGSKQTQALDDNKEEFEQEATEEMEVENPRR